MNEFSYSWWETKAQDKPEAVEASVETVDAGISEQPKGQEVIIINPGDNDDVRLVPRLR